MVRGFFLVQESSLIVEYRALIASSFSKNKKTRAVAQWLKVLAAKHDVLFHSPWSTESLKLSSDFSMCIV